MCVCWPLTSGQPGHTNNLRFTEKHLSRSHTTCHTSLALGVNSLQSLIQSPPLLLPGTSVLGSAHTSIALAPSFSYVEAQSSPEGGSPHPWCGNERADAAMRQFDSWFGYPEKAALNPTVKVSAWEGCIKQRYILNK